MYSSTSHLAKVSSFCFPVDPNIFALTKHVSIFKWNNYHWTDAACSIRVKVHPDGMIGRFTFDGYQYYCYFMILTDSFLQYTAIVHNPSNNNEWTWWGTSDPPRVQSHVNFDKTVSFFYVLWDSSSVEAEKKEYPNVSKNACNGGTVSGEYCLCNTGTIETAPFSSLPTRKQVYQHSLLGHLTRQCLVMERTQFSLNRLMT